GQGDRWLLDVSLRPTTEWYKGLTVHDLLAIRLYPGIPPGTYRLVAGVYDRVNDDALEPVGDAQRIGTGAVIGSLEVIPSPRKATPAELGLEHPAAIELTPALRLLAWAGDREQPAFGQPFTLELNWQATARPPADYAVAVQLLDDQGRLWAQNTRPVGSEAYPTSRWAPDEVLRQYVELRVADEAPAVPARLLLQLLDSEGQKVREPVELARLTIDGHHSSPPTMGHVQSARLGEAIRLLGYDLAPTTAAPGQEIALVLYWRAEGPVSRSYKVFTHLLDAGGVVRGQQDNLPREGTYPTDRWQPGEIVVDRYCLKVDADAPPGAYRIEIGMYDPEQGNARLPLAVDGQRQPDDRLLLNTILHVR
ncbi:MAG: hypothetical protein H5T69_16725, partial [Chloroflexi bacterium]|nr:hypothetical protein [Chloroflexota bacterium]